MAKGSAGFFAGVGARLGDGRAGQQEHQEHGAHRLHEHLRRGACTDRELAFASAQPDAVGCRVAILDAYDLSRLQIVTLDEAQELAVLVAHAPYGDVFAERTGQQRVVLRTAERAFGSGNRVTMRVGRRPAEHLVDALDQPIGDGVFQMFGLVVDLGPAHPHDLHQEQLDQPVAAQHSRRELLAGHRQPDARIRFVADQPGLRQGLHHRGGGPGDDPQRRGQLAHRDQLFGRQEGDLGQKYGFQVVFDGV